MTAEHPGYADEAEIRATVERYVDELKAEGAIGPATVERAFRSAQRHRLLDPPPGGWQIVRRFYRELLTLG